MKGRAQERRARGRAFFRVPLKYGDAVRALALKGGGAWLSGAYAIGVAQSVDRAVMIAAVHRPNKTVEIVDVYRRAGTR